MANRIGRGVTYAGVALALAAGLGALSAGPRAEPVYKDLERAGGYGPRRTAPLIAPLPASVYAEPDTTRPPRRLNGGPGYVGSDYGLGKPSVTGLGTRPDWGRSSD